MTRDSFNKHWEIIEAYKNGAEIEYRSPDDDWRIVNNPVWSYYTEYRIKPTTEYVPFDFTDAEFLIGKVVKHKDLKEVDLILGVTVHSVCLSISCISFEDLLKNYTFLDGTPCGKLKQ